LDEEKHEKLTDIQPKMIIQDKTQLKEELKKKAKERLRLMKENELIRNKPDVIAPMKEQDTRSKLFVSGKGLSFPRVQKDKSISQFSIAMRKKAAKNQEVPNISIATDKPPEHVVEAIPKIFTSSLLTNESTELKVSEYESRILSKQTKNQDNNTTKIESSSRLKPKEIIPVTTRIDHNKDPRRKSITSSDGSQPLVPVPHNPVRESTPHNSTYENYNKYERDRVNRPLSTSGERPYRPPSRSYSSTSSGLKRYYEHKRYPSQREVNRPPDRRSYSPIDKKHRTETRNGY